MHPLEKEWLNCVMEEYKSLRTECLDSIKNRQSVLHTALISLAGIYTIGFYSLDKLPVTIPIFFVIIPITSYMFTIIWGGELIRMVRAGRHNLEIEEQVNLLFLTKRIQKPALCWEHFLNSPLNRENYSSNEEKHLAVFCILIVPSLVALIVGSSQVWCECDHSIIFLVDLAEVGLLIWAITRVRKILKLHRDFRRVLSRQGWHALTRGGV